MNQTKLLLCLFIVVLSAPLVFQSRAVSSDLKIIHEPYKWTEDMKLVKITTPEVGLTFKITISNNGTEPLEINQILYINVKVESKDRLWSFYRQLQISSLYLPPKEAQFHYVKVDFGGGIQIGSYTAKLSYFIGSVFGDGMPIEEYPFEFKIASENELQQAIQQNKGRTTYTFPININITLVESGIGISVLSIGVLFYLWNRKEKNSIKQIEKGKGRKIKSKE